MSIREFWSLRRTDRRARRLDRWMQASFGQSWVVNRDAVYGLLTAPTPLVVLDVGMLRGVVAEALASSASTEVEQFGETFEDEALADEPSVPLASAIDSALPPAAEVPAEPYVEERSSNGIEAVPFQPVDERRRAFLSSFLQRSAVPTR